MTLMDEDSEAGAPTSPPLRRTYSDRFIPSRTASRLGAFELDEEPGMGSRGEHEDSSALYGAMLRSSLLGDTSPAPAFSPPHSADREPTHRRNASLGSPVRNLFRFASGGVGGAGAMPPESPFATSPLGGDGPIDAPGTARKPTRKIARAPFKVLDAPQLADDFYLNLVDWSSANVLAVGLGACVYLWSACTSKVTKLADLSGTTPEAGDAVTSVSWSQRGSFLAIGTGKGEVQLWDVRAAKKVRTCGGHRARVASLAWTGSTLSSGSRDRSIINRDVRAAEESFGKLTAHRSEVCGLRWSPDGRELASGGNDNALCVWSSAAGTAAEPYLRFTSHTAAVKALAWSPHAHGLLASGGGTADRHIRFWNTSSGAELSAIDTGSQVCSLAWSKNCDELVSTHGYSQNQVVVWRYPSMTKVATLTGHTMRVLYLAVSPDGTSVVTGAGDETLRFWSVFPPSASGGAASDTSVLCLGRSSIR